METHCCVLYIVTLHVDVSSALMVILLCRQQYNVLGLYVKHPIVLTNFFPNLDLCDTSQVSDQMLENPSRGAELIQADRQA